MDPQQRVLLETSYQVLVNAQMPKAKLMKSITGVYIGVWSAEFAEVLRNSEQIDSSVYAVTGATCSVIVGRVSFALGLQGPCVSFDTACSSGVAASTPKTEAPTSWSDALYLSGRHRSSATCV